MSKSDPAWKNYERLVAKLVVQQIATNYCVTLNARIFGVLSRRSRQVDVLIDMRHETDNSRRVIIDAKARSRKIDVTHVEAFLGLMADVGATHGYLVCPHGYTAAAQRRAQDAVSIRLLPLDRLDNFDPSAWPDCKVVKCRGGKVFWNGYPSIDTYVLPFLDNPAPMRRVSFIHYVGKCDRCLFFHVRCMACRELFSLNHESDDGGYQCQCRRPWFWLASLETDDTGRKSAELQLVISLYGGVEVRTVDRRSM